MSGFFSAIALHGRLRFFGLAANLHILLLVDQHGKPLPEQRMIVNHKNRFPGFLCRLLRVWKWWPCSILFICFVTAAEIPPALA